MSCKGLHCPGCGSGKSGIVGAVVLLVIGAAIWHAHGRAITHAADTALTIAAVTVASIAGAVVLGLLTWAGLRVRRAIVARSEPRPVLAYRAEPVRPTVAASERPALRLVSIRALPAPGPQRAAYGSERPAGARARRGRGKRP